jgi:hypothetical protein
MFSSWIERLFGAKEAAHPETKPVVDEVQKVDEKPVTPVEPLQDEVKVAEPEKAKTDWDRFQDSYHEFLAANPSIKGSKLFIEWARRNFDANGKLNNN